MERDRPVPLTLACSLNGAPGPIVPLARVTEYLGQETRESLEGVTLPRPLRECIERDVHPLPATADREGYHGDKHYDFWLSGLKDYARMREAAARHGVALEGGRILDFGCASGRVLRHFLAQGPAAELWGSDINLRNVEWVRRFLPDIKVFQNLVLPNLPCEDRSFRLVYAFSVFTHIDDWEITWLLELRRILEPGGIAYLTLHTDHTWSIMGPRVYLYHLLKGHELLLRDGLDVSTVTVTDDFFARPMPSERLAFRFDVTEGYGANVFHTADYVRTVWGRYFEVLDLIPEGSGYQDVAVLRKR